MHTAARKLCRTLRQRRRTGRIATDQPTASSPPTAQIVTLGIRTVPSVATYSRSLSASRCRYSASCADDLSASKAANAGETSLRYSRQSPADVNSRVSAIVSARISENPARSRSFSSASPADSGCEGFSAGRTGKANISLATAIPMLARGRAFGPASQMAVTNAPLDASIRRIPASAFDGSGRSVTPQRQRMASKLCSRKSSRSASASMNSTFVRPSAAALSRATSSIRGERSVATTRPA